MAVEKADEAGSAVKRPGPVLRCRVSSGAIGDGCTEERCVVQTADFLILMDLIGTIAFALSGAMLGIRKNMVIFGVNILAIVTATGGGVLRDMLIGRFPPVMMRNPFYVLISAVTANVLFVFFSVRAGRKQVPSGAVRIYQLVLFWFDSLGLAAFTVDGVYIGHYLSGSGNLFSISFLGVLTGVGGGIIRDLLADQTPDIFVKHVYACASICGAVLCGSLLEASVNPNLALLCGFGLVLLIRILAAHYRWNLPKVGGQS